MENTINYTREAFLHPINLAMLIVAFSSAFMLSGVEPAVNILLVATVAAELLYLGSIPRTARFQKYINLRSFKERNSKFNDRKVFGQLSEQSQKKFLILKHISSLIRDNFKKMPYTSQGLLDNINTRINSLLTSYMLMLESNERYLQYLNNTTEKRLGEELEQARKEQEEADSPRLKQVLQRRIDILNKRYEKYGMARERYQISDSQIKTVEDTVRYIYEKSMTLTNPGEIEQQMDSLLMDLEDTDATFSSMGSGDDVSGSQYNMDELRRLEREMEKTDELFKESAGKASRSKT